MNNTDLTEITNARQANNGTRMFRCSRTNTIYGSYASGYIRRGIPSNIPSNAGNFIVYQINPKTNGNRVMITSEADRLAEIDRLSSRYRTCFHP